MAIPTLFGEVSSTSAIDLGRKLSCRVATAAPLPAVTAAGSGIGKTLTADAVGVLTVDGIATVLNDRVLVKNQVAGANNGIYLVTTEGTAGVAFVLTRATDFDTSAEMPFGASTWIEAGTTNGLQVFALSNASTITIETTALTFSAGLAGSVDLTSEVTGILPVANGGTNASTASITSFNNITGFTAAGATGTTSTNLVFSTSPTLVTPTLGVASATTINKVTLTTPATGSTLTIADGKTLTSSNTLTFTGTDASSVAFSTGGTVAYVADKLSVFAATTSAELAGVISDETGSGALMFGTAPTITTSLTMADAANIIINATTGTKFGTAITQKIGFWNATPVIQSTGWAMSNVTTDKVLDANSTTIDELADVVGTLIDQLKTYGILGA